MKSNINLQTSCIIPFWNEGSRLYAVLDEVIKVQNIQEIICVDDASGQDNSAEIRKKYPHVKLTRLEKNLGKSGAIHEGLKIAKGNIILLFDADLRNLNHVEIEAAVDAFQQTPDIDMLILRRIKAPLFVRLTRGDILVTGERVIRPVAQ